MKHPLPLLFALMATAVLLGMGGILNNACKVSFHAWCDPTLKIRQGATRSQEGDGSIGHTASHVSTLFQK